MAAVILVSTFYTFGHKLGGKKGNTGVFSSVFVLACMSVLIRRKGFTMHSTSLPYLASVIHLIWKERGVNIQK